MVEAGTGVGKSFAYLVPAIMAAVEQKKKVIVATHTINLQEQLLLKDIPFLRSVMPQEFTAVLVKGRSNYISIRRLGLAQARAGATFNKQEEFDELKQIREWAENTNDGSKSDLHFDPLLRVWEAINSDNDNCLGRKCPEYEDCFFYKARRRMANANLLIVNHALFMRDLAVRATGGSVLPDYDIVVIDEAHQLEEVASTHLGLTITNSQLEYAFNRLYNVQSQKGMLAFYKLNDAIHHLQSARSAARRFFEDVDRWRTSDAAGNGRLRQPLPWSDEVVEEIRKLRSAIEDGARGETSNEAKVELTGAADRCDALAITIQAWQKQTLTEAVYWVEATEGTRRRLTLSSSPLEVGTTLREVLFNSVECCVLTSATLCVGSPPAFSFFKERLGLTACETLQLGSPFDYPRQVTIHLPRDLPDPSEQSAEYERSAIQAIPHYLEKTNGKAFVLFTSYKMMDAAARALTPWFAKRNIALFSQSDGLPRSKMVEAFKSDVNSVIFGADSFWQGVDVPGEALSNVIIVRLPFSVPSHPLLEARLEDIRKRGGNPFLEYQVPEAVIKLKQGFGRLIRSKTDKGIVVILDPRVLTKPYGRTFLSSLPECPRVIEDLRLPR